MARIQALEKQSCEVHFKIRDFILYCATFWLRCSRGIFKMTRKTFILSADVLAACIARVQVHILAFQICYVVGCNVLCHDGCACHRYIWNKYKIKKKIKKQLNWQLEFISYRNYVFMKLQTNITNFAINSFY